MAKRTIKPSKQKAGEPETVTLPEQPVEVKAEPQPDAADLLDMPPVVGRVEPEPRPGAETIPATLVEPEAEKPDESGHAKQLAYYQWQNDLEDAKNDHLEACLQLREAQQLVKAAREREKDALDYYRELHARGPVVPKPVTPPEEQSGTQQPIASDSSQAEGENAWRAIPLTELSLDSIQGLGEKKRDALLDTCPTLGHFVDKQVGAGASGVNTVLPKGIGKAITDPLEEMLLDYLVKWRASQGNAGDMVATPTPDSDSLEAVRDKPTASSVPSFTEWELMTSEQQHDWINNRATQISEGDAIDILKVNLSADFQAGGIAYGRGERVVDCPRIPGDELDQWLAGYFDAARDDVSDQVDVNITPLIEPDDPEPELAEATTAASSPAFSLMDLDDI